MARVASSDALRIVQWNVRRCIDPASGRSSSARVLSCVERLRPSLLSLNELDLTKAPTLLDDLSALGYSQQSFFGHVRDGTYGNALVSTLPLTDAKHTHLDGGTVVNKPNNEKHRIARGMLSASVAVGAGVRARVAVTHLDHMCPVQRRVQTAHLLRTLLGGDGSATAMNGGAQAAAGSQASGGEQPLADDEHLILLGDLNALSRADYTPEQWQLHEAHNAAKGWSPPHDDAAADGALGMLMAAGFVDCAASLSQRRLQTSSRAWAADPWTAHVRVPNGPPYRIDYVWMRTPQPAGERVLVTRASHVEMECGAASDHQPLVVDLEAVDQAK